MTSTPETPPEPSEQDLADLAAMAAPEPTGPTVKAPSDRVPPKDDGSRVMTAEQLVDKAIERAGNGLGVVAFIGTMLGQLGEFVTENDLRVDWGNVMIRTRRTEKAGIEAETHNIVPKGTLVLVLDATVRPSRS